MAVTSDRLRARIWVQAQVRICDLNCLPIAVLRKGDEDAGAVLLKLSRRDGVAEVLAQMRTAEGESGWIRAAGGGGIPDEAADAYIGRQIARDPDLWVIEIHDPDGRYHPDGEIV
jgi:hypothetical protein